MRILDLARSLIRLSGKSERDLEIQFTGLREGEKLNEELFYLHERAVPSSCERIKRTKPRRRLRKLRITRVRNRFLRIRIHHRSRMRTIHPHAANPQWSAAEHVAPPFNFPVSSSSIRTNSFKAEPGLSNRRAAKISLESTAAATIAPARPSMA